MKMPDIQKMKTTVLNALGALKLTKAADLDSVARDRMVLREKLDLLAEAESAEVERIEAEKQAALVKHRAALLTDITTKADTAAKDHAAATKEANKLMHNLAGVLFHRSQIFSRESCGLAGDEMYDLLTTEERYRLFDALDRTAPSSRAGNFGTSWKDACSAACGDDQRLFNALLELVNMPRSDFAHEPLAGSNDSIILAVKSLQESKPIEVKPQLVTKPTAPAAVHNFEIDLRGPGNIRDLNEKVSLTN